MKKYLSRLLTLAVIVPALVSCMEQLQDNRTQAKKHTVYFSTVVEHATKTGLTVADGTVTPDWRVTDPLDVHFFEMNGTSSAHMGVASDITSYDGDLGAHFKADIEQEITIYVNPPDNPTGDGQKVLRQGRFTYGAVVAKSKEVNDQPVFYIPAIQKPVAGTLKDPGAEFLVGYSRDGYDAATIDEEGTVVDLYFDRVAALSRIGFTNFQGTAEKVKSVTINSEASMTGSVKASDISFGNPNSVSWTPDTGEGAGVLTLDYGEGVSVDGTFYAYFVSMPGTFKINSIVVETDQYRYTKAYTDGKDLTFDLAKLANLTMDLSDEFVNKEEISSNVDVYYVLVTSEPASWDGTYLIVNTAADGKGIAMDGDSTAEVTISGGKILSDETTDSYALTVISAGEVHPNQNGQEQLLAYDIRFKDGDWLYNYSSKYKQDTETEGTRHNKCTLFYDNEGVRLMSAGYLKNLNGQQITTTPGHYYLNYQSSGFTMTKDLIDARVQLFMLVDNREAQTLSFSPATATYDLYAPTSFEKPRLSTAYGDVTYSSSDETIAEVDNSGNITGKKTGTVTITATAAGNTQYKPATASYELTVVNNDPNVKVYRKVTNATELEEDAQYLLVFEGLAGDTDGDGDPKVFNPVLNSAETQFEKATSSALDVTIANSTISSNDFVDYQFTLEDGYYLKANKAGKYIYPGSSNNSNVLLAESTATNALTITFNGGIAQIQITSGTTTRYIVWSTNNHYFSCNTAVSGTYSTGICLYKLEDNRPAWTMSFSPAAATYDLYTKQWTPGTPALSSNATTTVTYTSSDESVATVNASGVVTPIKKGTATISAIAAADANHKRTVASYELTVEDSSPTKVYTRVESDSDLEVGANYLIVYESSSKVFKPILASSTSTTFTAGADNVLSATISNKTITSNDFVDCELTLEDGYYFYVESADKYLYPSASGIGAEKPKDSGHSFSISINSGTASLSRTSYNSTYRIVYYNSYFQSRTDNANIALYKLEDNRPAWTMSYSPTAASYDLYTKEWNPGTPALTSDATTTITYTSSDESVATVDASGVVTPIKQGTVTISAIAAADATHKRTVVSYELTVDDSSPAKEYVRVESAADLEVGAKYLIVYESGSYVFKPYLESGSTTVFAKATDNKEAVTISDHKIVSNALDDWQITLETGYYLYVNSASKYLYPASSSGTALNAESSPTKAISISISNGIASIQNNAQYIYYSTNSKWFSSTGTAGNANTALYKLDDGRIAQSISFSKSSAEYDLGTLSWTDPKPIIDLTGVHTTVTYESSDPTVATVTNDGDVNPLKKGSTKITAKAVGNATYKPAEASYTLTVKNSAQTAVYYTKVSDTSALPTTTDNASGNYIFVYKDGDKAYVFKPMCATAPTTGGGSSDATTGHVELTKTGSAIEVPLTSDGIEATSAIETCKIQMKKKSGSESWYLYSPANSWWFRIDNTNKKLVSMTSSGYGCTFSFSGSGNNLQLSRSSVYMVYNSANICFEASSTASKISIYKLEDSSNP